MTPTNAAIIKAAQAADRELRARGSWLGLPLDEQEVALVLKHLAGQYTNAAQALNAIRAGAWMLTQQQHAELKGLAPSERLRRFGLRAPGGTQFINTCWLVPSDGICCLRSSGDVECSPGGWTG